MVTINEVRTIALSLPETEEKLHQGKVSFRVRNKIFAVIQPDGVTVTIKTTMEERTAYTSMAPDTFKLPESFAHLAYMNIRLDRVEPDEFRDLLMQAWKYTAPKTIQ